jgi:hypothetical protein
LAKTRENEKDELGIAHERLVDDHEKLEKEFMSLKEIHDKLTKSHDQLLAQYSNKQVMSPFSTSINISSSNSCATTNLVGGKKIPNIEIDSQKVKSGKEGLGFVAKPKKKNNKKRNIATSPSQNITFVKEVEVVKEKETNTIEGGETSRGAPLTMTLPENITPLMFL